jgi:hypothetical protein
MSAKFFSVVAILCLSLPAFAQHKHVHGEGRLDLAIVRDTVTLDLELPLDAVVGFERAPKSAKEQAALAAAEKTLKDAAALWLPSPVADCKVEAATVGMPQFGGGHVDIDANYVFRCKNPVALKGIETTLFDSFKRLYRLEVQRTGPGGQGAQRLAPKNPVLTW